MGAAERRARRVERRIDRRRRRIVAGRHALGRTADRGDARGDGARHRGGGGADPPALQHPRRRRPLVRQRAARSCRCDDRVRSGRRPDARRAALDADPHGARRRCRRAAREGPDAAGSGGDARPRRLQRAALPLRVQGDRATGARPIVRRPGRARCRRAHGRARIRRPRTHRRRCDRLAAGRQDRLRRRHPLQRRHADHVGGTGRQLDRRPRSDREPRPPDRDRRPRPDRRPRRRRRPARLLGLAPRPGRRGRRRRPTPRSSPSA